MGEDIAMSFNVTTAFEMYMHANSVFKDEDDWVHGFNDRAKFLDIEWDLWSTDNIYIYFDFALLMNSLGNHHNNVDGNYLYKNSFVTNAPFLPPADLVPMVISHFRTAVLARLVPITGISPLDGIGFPGAREKVETSW